VASPDDEIERTMIIRRKPEAEPVLVPDAVGHYLVVSVNGEPGKRVELGTEPLTIGRDSRQGLVLTDTQISRSHARVSLAGDAVTLEDLASTNGTFFNGQRLTEPIMLKDGDVVRMGSHFLKYERRSRRDVARTSDMNRELERASHYVLSLLPPALTDGPVRCDWRFVPSTQLAGDAFGYSWLDPTTFVFYLFDVSGHGAGSAMHSVSVLNVLRQRALPQVDFTDPAAVLTSLNDRFEMSSHNGLFFTMWYGVYRTDTRTLTYGSGGHHPAYLVDSAKSAATPLGEPALMIGAIPGMEYERQQVTVPPGSSLYLFSDGVFEVEKARDQWSLADFVPLLTKPGKPGVSESDRLYDAVKEGTGPGPLDDDVSLLVLTFL
jgi:serine phosphatase RsbU (regulator of sigma subunit)